MENVLELRGVCKSFKTFSLDDVSFTVPLGSVCGFVGINGAGKSTTVKIIEGLLKKDAGEVILFGEKKLSSKVKSLIGFVPDSCYFYEKQTLLGVKKFISGMYDNWDEQAYRKYMDLFGLDEKKKTGELSKGMSMQFSLALALSHNAKLLIMDEPTSGLDPYIRSRIVNVLKEFVRNGENSVIFSTHILSDLEKTADKIVFIHDGRIVFEKKRDDLPLFLREKYGIEHTTLDDSIVACIEQLKIQASRFPNKAHAEGGAEK